MRKLSTFPYLLLIAIVGFFVYSNTFNASFHFDDMRNISENSNLKDLSNFWPPSGSRWFGFLTFALNYKFGGLNVTDYHIVNLIIHILNAILVYWFVVLTFRTPYFKVSVISAGVSNQPTQFNLSTFQPFNYLPLFIALLFVAHPIQTQAVTYIVQRFTSLATMFYLFSVVTYIRSRLSTLNAIHTLYAVSLISAILAMKTKEISFTLPVVITLYEFMFFEGKIKKRILYLIPFLLTMLIIPLSLIGIDKPIGDAIGELREAAQETEQISRWGYLFTQFRVIVTYIRLLFLPINQNLDYDYPIYHSFLEPNVFLSFVFLLLIFGLGIYLFYRSWISHPEQKAKGLRDTSATPQNDINIPTRYTLHPPPYTLIAFGIFWFLITLSVESSIVPIVDVIYEHRLYLPSVGFLIAVTTSVFLMANKLKNRWQKKAVIPALAVIIIVLSGATYSRNIVWQSEVSLWEDVVKKSSVKARGYNNLGNAYYAKGLLDKAIEYYQIALRLKPEYGDIHINLGNAFRGKGLLDKAIEHYQIALKLKPFWIEAHNNLAAAYYAKGWIDEAIAYYQIILGWKSNDATVHYNIAAAYHTKGLLDKAIEHYQIALRLKPEYSESHNNLGVIYEKKGLLDEATKEYCTALRLNSDNEAAKNNLNRVLQIKR